ncbi:MAG: hypothetical protein A4S09_05365 [Proteobacteria bacterium SG_bin7]|nr:MAG: hypothetical protein A4S09_05365 [Proteobacteria bacterium SG_bin7]
MLWNVLSLIISLSLADSAFYRPSHAEFQETKKIAIKIAKEYQEDKCEIIGIGRSPTVLIAFLKNLNLSNVSYLPLSEMNVFDRVQDINKYNKVFSYFDSMIPHQKKKKLVFVDFSLGGKSYLAQKTLIEAYLQAYHPEIQYEFLALVSEVDEKLIADFNSRSITVIKLKSKAQSPYGPLLWDSMYNATYEPFAPYKSFAPWRDGEPKSNSEFEKFKLLVKSEMTKYKSLGCELIF